jgi:hypothetical protein
LKSGLKAEEFVDIIDKASALSDNRLIPVDQLSNYHRTTVRVGETYRKNRRCKVKKQLQVLQDYNVTIVYS